MNCMPFRLTAVLAAFLAATACAEQEPESMAAPTPAAGEQGDLPARPTQPPSMPAQPAAPGVDQATPASVPDPGNSGLPTASPPTQSMPVPEELYPVDPAPVPPPER